MEFHGPKLLLPVQVPGLGIRWVMTQSKNALSCLVGEGLYGLIHLMIHGNGMEIHGQKLMSMVPQAG